MESKLLLIVNPAAGMGRGQTIKDEIARMYERYHWRCAPEMRHALPWRTPPRMIWCCAWAVTVRCRKRWED